MASPAVNRNDEPVDRREFPDRSKIVMLTEKPKPEKSVVLRVKVGWWMRLKINADFRLYKRLEAAGRWQVYYKMWQPCSRIMNGDCPDRKCGFSSQRFYGDNPNVVMKCLGCGAEEKLATIHNWP